MRTRGPAPALAVALLAIGLSGCGKVGMLSTPSTPAPGALPAGTVTKNTARLGDGTPEGDAAAVARAVYPGLSAGTRPGAVAVVNADDWQTALAAAPLAAAPLRLPLLYSHGGRLPQVSTAALHAMRPTGSPRLGGAQVLAVGAGAHAPGYATQTLGEADAPSVAAAVAHTVAATRGRADQVLIVSDDAPAAYAMPAAGLAAESGAPILFVDSSGVPAQTRAALVALGHPTLYVIGPDAAISSSALSELAGLGTVRRIRGGDPVTNAIAVAQYADSGFGWGVVDPGHGLVFVSAAQPLDAAAAAPLSASGDYGPILLLSPPGTLPSPLVGYLTAIQPGYTSDPRFAPVRGVYNRGWLIGDAVSAVTQARLDALLEISPRTAPPTAPASGP